MGLRGSAPLRVAANAAPSNYVRVTGCDTRPCYRAKQANTGWVAAYLLGWIKHGEEA